MTTERLRRLLNSDVSKMSVADMMDATEHEKREFLKAAKESANRDAEALRIYDPLPFQQAYHESNAKEVILAKGNRVGGAQPLTGRVLAPTGWALMADLEVGDLVIGGDGSPCRVTHIHERGWMPTYRIRFDDGATAVCTGDHLWRCKLTKSEKFPSDKHYKPGKWTVRCLDEIREFGGDNPIPRDKAIIPVVAADMESRDVPLDPYTLGVLLGGGSFSCGHVSFTTEDDAIADEVGNRLKIGRVTKRKRHKNGDNGNAYCYGVVAKHNCTTGKPSPIMEALRDLRLGGRLSHEKFIPSVYLFNDTETRLSLLRGLMDTDGYCDKKGNCYFYSNSPALCLGVVDLVRSLGGKAILRWKETSIIEKKKKIGHPVDSPYPVRKKCLNMGCVWIDLEWASPFTLERKTSRWAARNRLAATFGRFIEKIEVYKNAPCRCITVDNPAGTYVMENWVVTHNSLAGFAEDSRAVTAQDPYHKYPEKNGTLVTLGYGENHIGRVIHKFLFRSGSFKIIRDVDTGGWRPYRPWDDTEGGDLSREKDSQPAPPLIPPRYVENLTWERRGDRVFSLCILTTGWEIFALNSAGDPSQAQGFDVDLYHIDEDTAQLGWYEEAVGRTAITKGKIRWTALPHSKNDDILNMMQRADEQANMEHPTTVCLRATMFDNPYYPKESREASLQIWAAQGEDVVRKRAYGELVLDSVLMYPSFSKWTHDIICTDEEKESQAQRLWRLSNYTVPQDWCCDMIVDPGHTVAGVLFIATPPPAFGDFHVVYDELYIHQCTAEVLAAQAKLKIAGRQMERFIIDAHGGRLTDFGSGIRPQRQYEKELGKLGVKCNHTSNYFINGSDDIQGREESLRRWLQIRPDGSPTLYVDIRKCPNFVREMSRFKKKQQKVGSNMITVDEANRKGSCHLVETAEYGAANGLKYVVPRKNIKHSSVVKQILKARANREAARRARTSGAANSSVSLAPRGAS